MPKLMSKLERANMTQERLTKVVEDYEQVRKFTTQTITEHKAKINRLHTDNL
jgi:hypothetical protein